MNNCYIKLFNKVLNKNFITKGLYNYE